VLLHSIEIAQSSASAAAPASQPMFEIKYGHIGWEAQTGRGDPVHRPA